MRSIEIQKVKIEHESSVKMEYREIITQKIGGEDVKTELDFAVTLRYPIHDDFKQAMDELKPFLIDLCEAYEVRQSLDEIPDLVLNQFAVNQISLGGSDEHAGVTIVGRRKLKNKRVLNLVAPFTKFEDEHNPYKFGFELAGVCSTIESEAIQYLNGKHKPSPQMEMAFESQGA